jgi:hypothetical protein
LNLYPVIRKSRALALRSPGRPIEISTFPTLPRHVSDEKIPELPLTPQQNFLVEIARPFF